MAKPEILTPAIANWLLRLFLREDLAEEVMGDLEEKFAANLKTRSPFRARVNYWYQVLHYLRPFAIRKLKGLNSMTMFRHNLLLTYRNSKRYKSSFFINLTGLAIGLACSLLIALWVKDELSVDKYHVYDQRLFKVMSNHQDASGITTWTGTPGLLLDEIKSTIPEVEFAVASSGIHDFSMINGLKKVNAPAQFASADFFKVFSYPLLEGDKDNVLKPKNSIVISESLTRRLFEDGESAVGKMLDWEFRGMKASFQVTGIFADVPKNSSQPFDYVMSWEFFHNDIITYRNWYNYYAEISIVLNDKTSARNVEKKIDDIIKSKHEGEKRVSLFLQQYSDYYLHGKYENGVQSGGRIVYVILFSVIAVFILLIACINFMNLSTARASRRMKEVGIKKSLGAFRGSLINQYFVESVMMSFAALIVALLLVKLGLPQFNFITQKQLSLTLDWNLILIVTGIALLTGIIAGSYPALYLSGFNPVQIIKGKLDHSSGEQWIRKGLVVFQFTLSIVLIVAVVVIYEQVHYVQGKNLGYDRNNLLYFDVDGKITENPETFLNELRNLSGIQSAALSGFRLEGVNSTGGVDWEGKTEKDQIQFDEIHAGYGLLETLGVELVAGRFFSPEFTADTTSIIFNETAIKAMGMKDPIGKKIQHYEGERTIVGVVKDFNLYSLHKTIGPLLFLHNPGGASIMVRIESGKEQESIVGMERLYSKLNPGYTFNFKFVDDDYERLYVAEQRVSLLSKYFAGVAVFISCLGLFGLAAFTAERRQKEIAIRKVLGSNEFGIIRLLSGDFTKMVITAIFIAIPVSYFVTATWLESFPQIYRIELEWWFFAGAGIVALLIAWLTVGMQTVKASRMNPVNSLKSE